MTDFPSSPVTATVKCFDCNDGATFCHMNCGPAADPSGVERYRLAEERHLLMKVVDKMSARQFNEPEGLKINARIEEIDRLMGSPL